MTFRFLCLCGFSTAFFCLAYLFSDTLCLLTSSSLIAAVNTSARMETMGIPGCINLSTAARQALTTEIAACRNGRSVESWLDLSGASVVKRDPVEVKGKGFMDMYLLCPKGVPPPLARRLSMSANMAARRSSYGSGEFEQMPKRASQRSLVSRGSRKSMMSSEIEEESSVVLSLAMIYLDRACSVETLRTNNGIVPCPFASDRTVHRLWLSALLTAARVVSGHPVVLQKEHLESLGLSAHNVTEMMAWMEIALEGADEDGDRVLGQTKDRLAVLAAAYSGEAQDTAALPSFSNSSKN